MKIKLIADVTYAYEDLKQVLFMSFVSSTQVLNINKKIQTKKKNILKSLI